MHGLRGVRVPGALPGPQPCAQGCTFGLRETGATLSRCPRQVTHKGARGDLGDKLLFPLPKAAKIKGLPGLGERSPGGRFPSGVHIVEKAAAVGFTLRRLCLAAWVGGFCFAGRGEATSVGRGAEGCSAGS